MKAISNTIQALYKLFESSLQALGSLTTLKTINKLRFYFVHIQTSGLTELLSQHPTLTSRHAGVCPSVVTSNLISSDQEQCHYIVILTQTPANQRIE